MMAGEQMTIPNPLISVVIPTYNYGKRLPRAVSSVLPQLSSQVELLIVDDGSTDETEQTVSALQKDHPDTFRYIRKTNGGAASARNCGIENSHGQFLVFLDADDELVDGSMALLIKHLSEHPDIQVVIAAHWSLSAAGKKRLHTPPLLPEDAFQRVKAYLLDKDIAVSHGASAMHRDVFEHYNYPEDFRTGEDIPVFAQALANYSCSLLPQPMAIIHKHDDSLRHNAEAAQKVGLKLLDEVFRRLPADLQSLRKQYLVQRCLSLFRTCLLAGEENAARHYYCKALKADKGVLLKWSYTRKALRLWLKKPGG